MGQIIPFRRPNSDPSMEAYLAELRPHVAHLRATKPGSDEERFCSRVLAECEADEAPKPSRQRARPIEELLPVLAQVGRSMPPKPYSMTGAYVSAHEQADRLINCGAFACVASISVAVDRLAAMATDPEAAERLRQTIGRCVADLGVAHG